MRRRLVPFYIHLYYLFISLLLIFALVSGWHQYRASARLLLDNTHQHYRSIVQLAANEVTQAYLRGSTITELLSLQSVISANTLAERLASLPFFMSALERSPELTALFIGYDSGDFFLVRRYDATPVMQRRFNPPPSSTWIVQSISHAKINPLGEYLFYDAGMQLLEHRIDPAYSFDPLRRDWYRARETPEQLLITSPYRFATNGTAGITFARRTANGLGVAGSDIQLNFLNQLLKNAKITQGSRLALLTHDDKVIASTFDAPNSINKEDDLSQLVPLQALDSQVLYPMRRIPHSPLTAVTFSADDGSRWEGMSYDLDIRGGENLRLIMASPHKELLANALKDSGESMLISGLLTLLGLLGGLWFSRLASRPINALLNEVRAIEQFRFDEPVAVRTNILEIDRLANALGKMKGNISNFIILSQDLVNETHFDQLLTRILEESGHQTHAEGGILYLQDGAVLKPVQYFWHGPPDLVTEEADALSLSGDHLLMETMRRGELVQRLDATRLAAAFPLLPVQGKTLVLLALPLNGRDGERLGVLVLILDESTQPLSDSLLAFVQALASSAAVALNTQRLIKEQKLLLEAFIQIIAGAIDAKSPYTGGHCQRVPQLTKMLARAACEQTSGPFADFNLNEEEWETLHIAAWLHDCGKITTPEFVVDKATKLETLYNRIHEIRMRFEVLKRDAEIACWKGIAAGGARGALEAERDSQWAILDEEFAFVASCNDGSEFLSSDDASRLRTIAERTWLRTLSDHIGLSYEEKARKQHNPESVLPVYEPLLADRPDHIFPRSQRESMPQENPWRFRITVPEHCYNRGELHNLLIARGTLTDEERFKINEHIMQTIIMLEKLPFPHHLRQVPEIAGGHHERMDGKGYPRRLTGDQMSIPARMMAIADIFEALTAADRPYKRGKSLSEAIHIMSLMSREGHIDPSLFMLFLQEGIYLEYAQGFLSPEQIDAVDIDQYLPMILSTMNGQVIK